ncbi:phosphatidate cytidylyltransferase [uncultured Mailhella sp.]|uniref:phosphatidate cytidylyltransferase n=1 Tax=uncultured Mailhella sp. TaxID=1981031 RepID=UPI002602D634|nr:phosphatidate cytidylyltransferase [uncultured Mailhella sp.]
MNEKFRAAGLQTRLITGLLLAAALIAVWCAGGWYLSGFVVLVSAVGLGEYLSLFQTRGGWLSRGLGLFLGTAYAAICALAPQYPPHLFLAACGLVLGVYALAAWSREKTLDPLGRAAFLLGGIVYVPVLLAPAMHFSRWEQLLIVLVPALSDIAAYFAGVSFGKHHIWASVSPRKSVEGAAAGLAAAVAATCVLGTLTGKAPLAGFALLGLVLGIMAQLGDFFESALKRAAGVKDSSHLLPGHGGILDRIDSVLFCSGTYAVAAGFCVFF